MDAADAARASFLKSVIAGLDQAEDVLGILRRAETLDEAVAEIAAQFNIEIAWAQAIVDQPLRRVHESNLRIYRSELEDMLRMDGPAEPTVD